MRSRTPWGVVLGLLILSLTPLAFYLLLARADARPGWGMDPLVWRWASLVLAGSCCAWTLHAEARRARQLRRALRGEACLRCGRPWDAFTFCARCGTWRLEAAEIAEVLARLRQQRSAK